MLWRWSHLVHVYVVGCLALIWFVSSLCCVNTSEHMWHWWWLSSLCPSSPLFPPWLVLGEGGREGWPGLPGVVISLRGVCTLASEFVSSTTSDVGVIPSGVVNCVWISSILSVSSFVIIVPLTVFILNMVFLFSVVSVSIMFVMCMHIAVLMDLHWQFPIILQAWQCFCDALQCSARCWAWAAGVLNSLLHLVHGMR